MLRGKSFLDHFYTLYRVGRFAFSSGLFFLFVSLFSLKKFPFPEVSFIVLGIFFVVSVTILLLSKKHSLVEFVLDEVMVFVLVIEKIFNFSFSSLFLMFPVFFSSLLVEGVVGFVVLVVALCFNVGYFAVGTPRDIAFGVQVFLNCLALTVIALAGRRLRERIEKQEAYIASLEREKEQNRLYRRLYDVSAGLAHELKNPLASIKGAVELLKEGKRSDELFEIVKKEVERLDGIVRDFLTLARPPSPEKVAVSVPSVLKEILKNASVEGKEYELKAEQVDIKTDVRMFYIAVENLVRNAFQWAKGKVSVACRKVGGKVEIVVEDDGPGIPEEERERVFEPFYSKHPMGSGLGLPIVRKFIMESGGRIRIEKSSLGGARFVVELPVEGADEGSGS